MCFYTLDKDIFVPVSPAITAAIRFLLETYKARKGESAKAFKKASEEVLKKATAPKIQKMTTYVDEAGERQMTWITCEPEKVPVPEEKPKKVAPNMRGVSQVFDISNIFCFWTPGEGLAKDGTPFRHQQLCFEKILHIWPKKDEEGNPVYVNNVVEAAFMMLESIFTSYGVKPTDVTPEEIIEALRSKLYRCWALDGVHFYSLAFGTNDHREKGVIVNVFDGVTHEHHEVPVRSEFLYVRRPTAKRILDSKDPEFKHLHGNWNVYYELLLSVHYGIGDKEFASVQEDIGF